MVYLNFYGDNHQDHRAGFSAARGVVRPAATNAPERVLMYETPSSTEQSPQLPGTAFLPNVFVDVGPVLPRKLEAIACYEREGRPYPHPRNPRAIEELAGYRGKQGGLACAEGFMLVRDLWR